MVLMNARRVFWLFLLLYITLDLALPAMPGAFVFSAADSVESMQVRARRGRDIHAPRAGP